MVNASSVRLRWCEGAGNQIGVFADRHNDCWEREHHSNHGMLGEDTQFKFKMMKTNKWGIRGYLSKCENNNPCQALMAIVGKAYLLVKERPDAAVLPGSLPVQDSSKHENKEYDICGECAEDRRFCLQSMVILTKHTNPLSIRCGNAWQRISEDPAPGKTRRKDFLTFGE
ncbi:hypothetical protein BJV74DRAFT_910150 [Russula compacta]|nr:hypothetical protein BJV74DRAFT_910150 [Russula compacta]